MKRRSEACPCLLACLLSDNPKIPPWQPHPSGKGSDSVLRPAKRNELYSRNMEPKRFDSGRSRPAAAPFGARNLEATKRASLQSAPIRNKEPPTIRSQFQSRSRKNAPNDSTSALKSFTKLAAPKRSIPILPATIKQPLTKKKSSVSRNMSVARKKTNVDVDKKRSVVENPGKKFHKSPHLSPGIDMDKKRSVMDNQSKKSCRSPYWSKIPKPRQRGKSSDLPRNAKCTAPVQNIPEIIVTPLQKKFCPLTSRKVPLQSQKKNMIPKRSQSANKKTESILKFKSESVIEGQRKPSKLPPSHLESERDLKQRHISITKRRGKSRADLNQNQNPSQREIRVKPCRVLRAQTGGDIKRCAQQLTRWDDCIKCVFSSSRSGAYSKGRDGEQEEEDTRWTDFMARISERVAQRQEAPYPIILPAPGRNSAIQTSLDKIHKTVSSRNQKYSDSRLRIPQKDRKVTKNPVSPKAKRNQATKVLERGRQRTKIKSDSNVIRSSSERKIRDRSRKRKDLTASKYQVPIQPAHSSKHRVRRKTPERRTSSRRTIEIKPFGKKSLERKIVQKRESEYAYPRTRTEFSNKNKKTKSKELMTRNSSRSFSNRNKAAESRFAYRRAEYDQLTSSFSNKSFKKGKTSSKEKSKTRLNKALENPALSNEKEPHRKRKPPLKSRGKRKKYSKSRMKDPTSSSLDQHIISTSGGIRQRSHPMR